MALEIKLDCGGKEYRENIGKEGKKQIEKLELALRNQKAINVNDRGFNAKEKDLLISVPYPLSRGCDSKKGSASLLTALSIYNYKQCYLRD